MEGGSQRAGPGPALRLPGHCTPATAHARDALGRYSPVGWGSWCWASWASDRLAPWADLAMEDDTWSMAATSAGARWLRAAPALPEVHGQLQFRFRKSYDDRFPLPRGSSEQETRKVCRRSFHSDRSSHLLQI